MSYLATELALGRRVGALQSFMANLVVLGNLNSTPLTLYLHMHAVIQLMCSQNKLIVGELILAILIVASESDLVEVLHFQFVQRFQADQGFFVFAFAGGVEELGTSGLFPCLEARFAEVHFARWALASLYDDVEAEGAHQVRQQLGLAQAAPALEKPLGVDTVIEVER